MIPWKWIIIVGVIWVGILLLDEVAYQWWKSVNPGSRYTSIVDQTTSILDPSQPPQSGTE
jgi:hypothetical protein